MVICYREKELLSSHNKLGPQLNKPEFVHICLRVDVKITAFWSVLSGCVYRFGYFLSVLALTGDWGDGTNAYCAKKYQTHGQRALKATSWMIQIAKHSLATVRAYGRRPKQDGTGRLSPLLSFTLTHALPLSLPFILCFALFVYLFLWLMLAGNRSFFRFK